MAAAERLPAGKLVVTYLIGLFWAGFVLCRTLWFVIKNGPSKLFYTKQRNQRPQILNNPDLGTHAFVQLSEVKIHYVVAGERGKPLMLFVHGFPECWFSWRFQMQEFSKDYRVVALDMRGYGESDKPTGMDNYVMDKMANDLKELVIALGYDKCVLVVHDWGGSIGFSFAIRNPEMVEKLIACNIPHPLAFREVLGGSLRQFISSWYMFFFQLPYFPEFFIRSNDLALIEHMFNGQDLPKVKRKAADPDELEAYKWSLSQPNGLTCPINFYRAAFQYKSPRPPGGYVVPVPTAIIWGSQDFALSLPMVAASAQWIPNLKVRYIPEAGHWVQQQEPDKVNEYIREFLASSS